MAPLLVTRVWIRLQHVRTQSPLLVNELCMERRVSIYYSFLDAPPTALLYLRGAVVAGYQRGFLRCRLRSCALTANEPRSHLQLVVLNMWFLSMLCLGILLSTNLCILPTDYFPPLLGGRRPERTNFLLLLRLPNVPIKFKCNERFLATCSSLVLP